MRLGCAICVARQNRSHLQPLFETITGSPIGRHQDVQCSTANKSGDPPSRRSRRAPWPPQPRQSRLPSPQATATIATTGEIGRARNPSNVSFRVNAIRVGKKGNPYNPTSPTTRKFNLRPLVLQDVQPLPAGIKSTPPRACTHAHALGQLPTAAGPACPATHNPGPLPAARAKRSFSLRSGAGAHKGGRDRNPRGPVGGAWAY